jgi:TRAP-type uncharacterized transport system fused permease subunit
MFLLFQIIIFTVSNYCLTYNNVFTISIIVSVCHIILFLLFQIIILSLSYDNVLLFQIIVLSLPHNNTFIVSNYCLTYNNVFTISIIVCVCHVILFLLFQIIILSLSYNNVLLFQIIEYD